MCKEFYDAIEKDVLNEADDSAKYLDLARIAPTDKARRILTDMAAEERRHNEYLKEILADKPANLGGDNNVD